jgi:type II secretory pathway pseudopilin PulG
LKFAVNQTKSARRNCAAFTLAEVLAALLFMAIVIPVAVQGLRIASLAGEAASRKQAAARVAERILEENLVSTNWNKSIQNGTVTEGEQQFKWTMKNENWSVDSMQQLSVEVTYTVQDKPCSVKLATLVDPNVLLSQPTSQQSQ